MSVLSHLQNTVNEIKIADWERTAIDTSITTLSNKLSRYFDNLHSKFVFGSYDRQTILKRSKDADSDVDYMVIFKDGEDFKPQTLMTRLKTFAESNYSKNEIYQSSPTIVLELGHIKFELAPAKEKWGTIYIPAPASAFSEWIFTNPSAMKTELEDKHRINNYLIKELILILKYWNVKKGKVYSSYDLENYVLKKSFYFCNNLKDYFYMAVEGLPTLNLPEYKKSKVENFKTICALSKKYELDGFPFTAESEIKKEI